MRMIDPDLELVACGSSGSAMPTFGDWERVVLTEAYEHVDHVSAHAYYWEADGDLASFLASAVDMDHFIESVAATADAVRAAGKHDKRIHISFDEWNVWYHTRKQDQTFLNGDKWPEHPPLLEDVYNFEDVLQVGCILNTFIRRADVVKVACIAQLVNVIAPIMTEPGGPAWRQTIFYPYLFASKYGRGTALRLQVECPIYSAAVAPAVPYLDVAGVHNKEEGTLTFFLVNRHASEDLHTSISLEGFGPTRILDHKVIKHEDLEATNTAARPDNVVPVSGSGAEVRGNVLNVALQPHSYSMIRVTE
jgi:alpha-N-arabinofuranosidase